MAVSTVLDNRPSLQMLLDRLAGLPDTVLAKYEPPLYPALQSLLDASIAWVEDEVTGAFNPRQYTIGTPDVYDGNGTNQITLRKRPILSVQNLQVNTPILGYIRVYSQNELKVYGKQGIVKVFTYKLAVEQALLSSVDYQAWGHLFPPLPQCVEVAYTYGFPQYDPAQDRTSLDNGLTWTAGDTRDPELVNWLTNCQQAAVCDAAASFLAQTAGQAVGLVQSVSFDGYSKSMNPAAFGSQVQAFIENRDRVLSKRKRQFYMATAG
jgi:hypothetical protein